MFTDLIKQIDDLLTKKPRVVVAISGYGGSGKSTLAEKICEHYKVPTRSILPMDYLHSENTIQGSGVFDEHDWQKIIKILKTIHSKDRLQYTSLGFRGHSEHFDIPLGKVVVIEGVRLLRPEAMSYFDVSVWVDCPVELATNRAKDRDRSQGEDEEHIKRWDTEWVPQNDLYYNTIHPNKLATFIYKEYR